MTLEDIAKRIFVMYDFFDNIFIEDNKIICEESYDNYNYKNDDDCCDTARENGELIIQSFPVLEIDNYYCHRHKYAIVELKIK